MTTCTRLPDAAICKQAISMSLHQGPAASQHMAMLHPIARLPCLPFNCSRTCFAAASASWALESMYKSELPL